MDAVTTVVTISQCIHSPHLHVVPLKHILHNFYMTEKKKRMSEKAGFCPEPLEETPGQRFYLPFEIPRAERSARGPQG